MKIKVCKGCGQVPQAVDKDGNKVCITCVGLKPESGVLVEVEVDPAEATCSYCHIKASKTNWKLDSLPFYESRGNHFYCGCRGWD